MGLLVRPDFRSQGVGKALTDYRMNFLSKITKSAFYMTNETNKISIDLHKSYGFKQIDRGPGFLNLDFISEFNEQGVLFRIELN